LRNLVEQMWKNQFQILLLYLVWQIITLIMHMQGVLIT
jgi:hypothetical protein